ncbi:MAG: DUF4349 domain-containing protein [Firmicutes bacterium]|nr:DUF4349 domain-containing protein [Bacillota bacterium]
MKTTIKKIIICVLMVMLLAFTFMLAGCGRNSGGDYYTADGGESITSYDPGKGAEGFSSEERAVNSAEPGDLAVGDDGMYYIGDLPSTVDQSRVKLIYTADIRVETMDFDQTLKDLSAMVESLGGYFESSYTENGSYWQDSNYRYGSFTVRIPKDKYQEFVSSVADGMHVTQLSQNTQDVGQAYYEAETHLETLRNKHDRLEELLKQAASLSDIIDLENALSQTEYEIEMYSNELEKYDSLIDYSTITVTVETAYQYSPGLGEERGFFQRVWESFKEGLAGFGEGATELCEWIGYHIIQILIVIVVLVLFVKFGPHAKGKIKLGKRAKAKKKAMDQVEVVRLDGVDEENEKK